MKFPRVAAAQPLQTLLLLTTFVAIALTAILLADLISSFRTTVIADAEKSLAYAVQELIVVKAGLEPSDDSLKRASYEVLRSYPDVEGGYMIGRTMTGHTFPTYTERESELTQPEIEKAAVLDAIDESRRTRRPAHRVFDDKRDLVVVAAVAQPGTDTAAWAVKRYLNFNESRSLRRKLIPMAILIVALFALAGGLTLSYRMQRGFAAIQAGLARLQTEPGFRLPPQQHELQPIVGAINEMAERRQSLEAALRREDRLRVMGRVVAGIAHEIRNPLNSIRLTVQMIARRMRGHPAAEESVPMVLQEVDRLDSLLKSLLVFGVDEPGRVRRQPLLPILERTVALVSPHLEERGVTAVITGGSGLEVDVDAGHLQQALMNLLLNAADASGQGGTVTMSVEADEKGTFISVRDPGPGLSPVQCEHLFEAFYTTKPNGTGLGLAVTRTLLEKMGANIDYVADESCGAHFRIALPQAHGERSACQKAS
ncbi:MAG TPA: HAMP domain-containing sensor histidine kinase [Bryobacteraceae bacterium]|nr:HAMP domain-containing sensor histidine kinase [Bryobacteraceae bacterium]